MDPTVDLSAVSPCSVVLYSLCILRSGYSMQVFSVVSSDLMIAGARSRLTEKVEPGAEKARPKLLAFSSPDEPRSLMWAVYLDTLVCHQCSFYI